MANFAPLKEHMLYCLDRMIERYGLAPPFLEVGCGQGDVSAHLAARGFAGRAIDFSPAAIAHARARLARFPAVSVEQMALEEASGTYRTVIAWDVLEHIEDDAAALAHFARLLAPGGHLVLAVPSNPREWRWDDEFYGHFRRYTRDDLAARLERAGFAPQAFWDFTWPLFWAMRRVYTRVKRPTRVAADKLAATKASATVSAWQGPVLGRLLQASAPLWRPLRPLQFRLFRHATARGHEFFALAQKRDG